MNLERLETITTVSLRENKSNHILEINGVLQEPGKIRRLDSFLSQAGMLFGFHGSLRIKSVNNFPMAAGIASSASAYAALAVAINDYYALQLSQKEMTTLARLGSGSACRSIPDGFVEWQKGNSHKTSFAFTIADKTHWDLYDCILVVSSDQKKISSTEGHERASTSPYQSTRIHDTQRRLDLCRTAIKHKDFEKLADTIELDSDMMHAVMMTSSPPIIYWQPASIAIMQEVRLLRHKGVACAYTMDAGPNVHIICPKDEVKIVENAFQDFPGIHQILIAKSGGEAHKLNSK